MILRAKWVLPVSQPPIENGAVTVEGDSIVAVGPATGEGQDLGEVVLAPGLINAHCHLDYTGFTGQAPYRGSFIEWLMQMVALKRARQESEFLADIEAGIAELLASGTTTVVNIESFPALIKRVAATPLQVIWCPEVLDVLSQRTAAVIWQETEALMAGLNCGVSPHAPYSTSLDLYRLCAGYARRQGCLLTTHLAESVEEEDMFRRGVGPMFEEFRRLGRDMSDCKRVGPAQLLNEAGVLAPNCLVAHANTLTRADVELVAKTGTSVVHCPRTHQFFRRPVPMLEVLQRSGINICLGTDSRASNDSLDMFAEMQEVARVFARWSPEQVLALATTNAARALQQADRLGQLAAGARADLMAVPLAGNADPYEAVVYAEPPVSFLMIGGKVVRS